MGGPARNYVVPENRYRCSVVNEPLEQESNSVDDLAHLIIGVKISSGKNPDYSSDLHTE